MINLENLSNKMEAMIADYVNEAADKIIEEKVEEFKENLMKEKVNIAHNVAQNLKVNINNSQTEMAVNINISIR